MLRRLSFFLAVALASLAVFWVSNAFMPKGNGVSVKESAFDRVMRTGVLRCGYYVFPPVVMRDPNTNKMSGFSIDMMEEISQKTGIKIEWTEESTFGNWIPALQTGRYDAMCAPMWSDAALGREAIYTRPLMYAGLYPLVRADDHRFDGPDALERMNDPSITMLAQDGNSLYQLTKTVLPKAKISVHPAQAAGAQMMEDILYGKGDSIFLDKNGVIEYNKNNGDKLRILDHIPPVKTQPFVVPVYRKETELREFLDNAVLDLQTSGVIDRLIDMWEPKKGTFLKVAKPYEQ